MTINIEEDLILPILTAILTIMFVIGYQTLVPKSSVEELLRQNDELYQDWSATSRELDIVTKELETYYITEQNLVDYGASHIEARRAMMAAEVNGVDPKHLGL